MDRERKRKGKGNREALFPIFDTTGVMQAP